MLRIREVTDPAGLAALEPEWQALFDRSPGATPFQSWEWLSSWWKHLGAGRPWILVASDGEETVGLMPLAITRYRLTPLRQVRWMGAPLSDYQDFLGPEPRRAECAAAFIAHLAERRARWDLCDLNDLPGGSALPSLAIESLRVETVFHRMCPVIRLGPSYDGFLKSLGKNLRANVGRRRRQLEKAFAAELDTVKEGLPQAMEELFRLHNRRWRRRGAMGAFSGARIQAFHHEIAQRFLDRGWLKLHRLRLDGETRAAFYCFQRGERVYYYLSGFDPEIGKFSPGNVMMGFAIEQAIASGARAFDLLRGDETYKYAWKAEDEKTVRMILGHRTLRSRAATGGHAFERLVEREGLKAQRRLWGRKGETARGGEGATLATPPERQGE